MATPRGGMRVRVFFVLQEPNSNTGLVFTYIRTHSCLIISGNEQQSNNNIFLLSAKLSLRNLKALTQDLIHEKQYSSKYCALNGAGNTQAAVTPQGGVTTCDNSGGGDEDTGSKKERKKSENNCLFSNLRLFFQLSFFVKMIFHSL